MAESQAENEPGVDVSADPVKVAALVEQFQNEGDSGTSESVSSPIKRTPRHKAFEMFERSGRIMGMPAPPNLKPPTSEESMAHKQTSDGLIGGSDEAVAMADDSGDIKSPTTLKHLTPSRPRGPPRRKPTRIHNTGDSEDNETEDITSNEIDEVAKRRHEALGTLEAAVNSFALKLSKEKGFDSCTVQQEDIDSFKQLVNLSFPNDKHYAEVEAPTSLVFNITAESPTTVSGSGSKSGVAAAAMGGGGVGALFGGAVGSLLGGPLGVAAGVSLGGVLGIGIGALYRGKSGGHNGGTDGGDSNICQFSIHLKQVFQQSNEFREDKDKGMAYFKV